MVRRQWEKGIHKRLMTVINCWHLQYAAVVIETTILTKHILNCEVNTVKFFRDDKFRRHIKCLLLDVLSFPHSASLKPLGLYIRGTLPGLVMLGRSSTSMIVGAIIGVKGCPVSLLITYFIVIIWSVRVHHGVATERRVITTPAPLLTTAQTRGTWVLPLYIQTLKWYFI